MTSDSSDEEIPSRKSEEMPSDNSAEEVTSENSDERMPAVNTSQQPWMESDWWKELTSIPKEPDNFHQVHLPRVFDVGALTYLLESKGIAPLVWGEVAALAYHCRTVPPSLFFIVRDNLFGLAIDTLTRAGLERKATFGLGDEAWGAGALHKPYVRFRLRQDWLGDPMQSYLRVFSASEVGLSNNLRAWEDAGTYSMDSEFPSPAVLRHNGLSPRTHYKFLVTSQADFFAISLHLFHSALTGGFADRDVGGSLLDLVDMTRDAFETADGSPLGFGDIHVPEKYAELAFVMFSGLRASLPAITKRDPRGTRLRKKQDGVGTDKRVYLRTWATEV